MDSGITVTGAGSAEAPADLLRFTLGVGHDAGDVADAVDTVGTKTAKAIAALRDQGVGADDIHTTGVAVYPQYGTEPAERHSYRASHSISIQTAELDAFGRLLTAAIDAAGNDLMVEQTTFDVADKSALVRRARELAVADARERAEQLARLAGRELGRLQSVEETPAFGPIPFAVRETAAKGAVPLSMSVEPGRQTVEIAVTILWTWA